MSGPSMHLPHQRLLHLPSKTLGILKHSHRYIRPSCSPVARRIPDLAYDILVQRPDDVSCYRGDNEDPADL